MTRTLLIGTALLAAACNHGTQPPPAHTESSRSAESSQPAIATPTGTTGLADASVTVVGCLRGRGPFTLANVRIESNDASEPPRPLTPGATLALDQATADARASVNKQVRVTGQLAVRRPTPGTATAPPSGGSTSTRDDVRANSTTVATDTPDRPAQRLLVRTLQPIADSCDGR